ncbi:hypothetical protein PM3016_858 [Paenibacillus mucilaginosus 3016]|uniref:Uncharacterized protein n=2 Tax=Paenibacillus mucilaginosus TaxID=61624 RepID=H6N960_9BACL|nr:hypothetical protein PM3016_858 [Paenibacillus mucilaginosus 3016]
MMNFSLRQLKYAMLSMLITFALIVIYQYAGSM